MSIPNEIYLLIFQHLNKRTLWECLTVSKDWNVAVIRCYYQDITISAGNLTALTAHLEDEQSFRHCNWVKYLRILVEAGRMCYEHEGENSPTEFTQEQFLKFMTYLPNLKKIEISSKRYLKYLFGLDSNKYLTQIEEICVTHCSLWNEAGIFCDLYYKFRVSLKHACIHHEPKSFINSKYGGIINYLNQFKNLTHLTYYNNTTNEDVTLYQLQVSCPYLVMLDIHIADQVPEHEAGTVGFYNYNSLKKLIISYPYISASYIDLITEQLPSSVNDLTVTINEIDVYDWIDTVGIGKVFKLIKRMCQVNQVSFNFVPYKDYDVEHEDDEESFITLFYKLLHAFKRSQKMIYMGSFNDFRSVHHHINIENEELDFTYGMKYEDFYDRNETERPVLDLAIPDKSASIIGLDIMNVLTFHICKRIEGSTYKFLAYSLINCPNLQFVEYKAMNEPSHEFILCISPDDRHYQYCTKKLDPSTTSQDNLKVVKMRNFIPASDFLDLLSSNLPNINFMICEYEFIRKSNDSQASEHVVVDLSNFKNLEVFYFNLQLLLYKRESSVCFIKFNYLDGDNCYYQLTAEAEATEVKPVSLKYIQNNPASSFVDSITFKCEKIKKFVLYIEEDPRDSVEINYGGTPYIQAVDCETRRKLRF